MYLFLTVVLVELLDPWLHTDPKLSKTIFPRSLYNNQNCENEVWIHFSLAEIIPYVNQRTRGMFGYSRIPKEEYSNWKLSGPLVALYDTKFRYSRSLRVARDISQECWRFQISHSEVTACLKIVRDFLSLVSNSS